MLNATPKERMALTLGVRINPRYKVKDSQIKAVKENLEKAFYIDFNFALRFCGKVQRLSAIIHILRHELGMKIVEWMETRTGGSMYCLYEFAPENIQRDWAFIEDMSETEVKALDFAKARRDARKNESVRMNTMEGQMSIFDFMDEEPKEKETPKQIEIPDEREQKEGCREHYWVEMANEIKDAGNLRP